MLCVGKGDTEGLLDGKAEEVGENERVGASDRLGRADGTGGNSEGAKLGKADNEGTLYWLVEAVEVGF